jgi:hypothetical protein
MRIVDPWLEDYEAELAAAEVEAERAKFQTELREQFPPEKPEVAYDMTLEFPTLSKDAYTALPPVRVLPLLKSKYATNELARARAKEIADLRGERILRFFHTARCYVVHLVPRKGGQP